MPGLTSPGILLYPPAKMKRPPRSLRSLPPGPGKGPFVALGARQYLLAAGRH